MSTMAMTVRLADVSPQWRARIAGGFYLLNFVTGSLRWPATLTRVR
jgi:hypothetical protein